MTTRVADGGNAGLLKDTPICMYTEPDAEWSLENWNHETYSSTLLGATVVINILRVLGNPDAELITTSGAGYRPSG